MDINCKIIQLIDKLQFKNTLGNSNCNITPSAKSNSCKITQFNNALVASYLQWTWTNFIHQWMNERSCNIMFIHDICMINWHGQVIVK